jgi:hypothetical protein
MKKRELFFVASLYAYTAQMKALLKSFTMVCFLSSLGTVNIVFHFSWLAIDTEAKPRHASVTNQV